MQSPSSAALALSSRKDFRGRSDKYAPPARALDDFSQALSGLGLYDPLGDLITLRIRDSFPQRRARYIENWRYYEGLHTFNAFAADGEKKVVFNYCRLNVNLTSDWLVAKGFSFAASKGNEALAELVNRVWEYNGGSKLLWSASQFGGICGDTFIYVTVKQKDDSGTDLPKEQWTVRLSVLDPKWVHPVWAGTDRKEMTSCLIQFPFSDDQGLLSLFTANITPSKITSWVNREKVNETGNPLGKVNVVHIQHEVVSNSLFGLGEIDTIRDTNTELNTLAHTIKKILKYHAEPTTLVFGATVSSLEKGANKCWSGLPVEGRVENLQLTTDLKAIFEWFDRVKKEMAVQAELPMILLDSDNFKHVSNTSGIAMQLMFQPLVGKTERRRVTYGAGLAEVAELIILAHEKIIGDNLDSLADVPGSKYTFTGVFTSALPKDEVALLDMTIKKMQAGIISEAEAIRTCSDTGNMKRLLLELAADSRAKLALVLETAQATSGETPAFSCVMLASPFLAEDLEAIAAAKADSESNP